MMVALLYAYARGLRWSRAIERSCVEDIAFRVIAAPTRLGSCTIKADRLAGAVKRALAPVVVIDSVARLAISLPAWQDAVGSFASTSP